MTILDRLLHGRETEGKRPNEEPAEGEPATKIQKTETQQEAAPATAASSSMDLDVAQVIEDAVVETHQVTKPILHQQHIEQNIVHEHHVEQKIVHEHHVDQDVVHEHHVNKTIVHEHHVDQPVIHEMHKDKEIIHEKHSTKDVIHEKHIEKPIIHEKHIEKPVIHEKHVEKPVIHEKHIDRPIVHETHMTQPIIHETHTERQVVHEVHTEQPVVHEHHKHQDVIHERHIDKPIIHERHIVRPVIHEVHVNKPIIHEHEKREAIVESDTKVLKAVVRADSTTAETLYLQDTDNKDTVVRATYETAAPRHVPAHHDSHRDLDAMEIDREVREEAGAALNTEIKRENLGTMTAEVVEEFAGREEPTVLVEEVAQVKLQILREDISEEQTVVQDSSVTLPVRVDRVEGGSTTEVLPEWRGEVGAPQILTDSRVVAARVLVEHQSLPAVVIKERGGQAPAVLVEDVKTTAVSATDVPKMISTATTPPVALNTPEGRILVQEKVTVTQTVTPVEILPSGEVHAIGESSATTMTESSSGRRGSARSTHSRSARGHSSQEEDTPRKRTRSQAAAEAAAEEQARARREVDVNAAAAVQPMVEEDESLGHLMVEGAKEVVHKIAEFFHEAKEVKHEIDGAVADLVL